jgi:putative oxidoreductase
MVLRRLARMMLASPFVTGGIDTLRNPGPRATMAEPVVSKIVGAATPAAQKVATKIEGATEDLGTGPVDVPPVVHEMAAGNPLPFETETYVKANAAVQVGAGLLLASGKVPRLASLALAVTLLPTTVAGHRFWELEGDERMAQQIHFTKNVAMLGGLVLAALDTEGRPDLRHRAQAVTSTLGAKAHDLVDATH